MSSQRRVQREAAEWLAVLHSGDADQGDIDRCRAWRDADPAHERAYRKVEALWRRFDGLDRERVATTTLHTVLGETRRRTGPRGGLLTLVAMLLFGGSLLAMRPFTPLELLADYRSGVGEQREVLLPDGSRLLLNTASAVDLAYHDGERRVRLLRGELLAEVAKDRGRPFVVETGQGTARALGTRFTVRAEDDTLRTVVTESAVELCASEATSATRPDCVSASAGQSVNVSRGQVHGPRPVSAAMATAWVRGRLVADDQPLAELLAELSRYRRGLLRYDPAALAGLRVSGVFPLDDTDRALAMLADYLPIDVARYTPLLTVIRPAPESGD